MSIWRWFKGWFSSRRRKASRAYTARPLREFVYLDEVSLRSLLSSQTGEVTDTRSEQSTKGTQLNIDSAAGMTAPGFSKADLTSRYQTSNSSSLQTSRKATVQSWFGELHGIDRLRLVEPGHSAAAVVTASELLDIADRSVVAPSNELVRGALVEFKVKLRADPVFHLGTIMSEFTSIVDETPEILAEEGVLRQLRAFLPVNRVLQRMLAGLIPIRCEALEHVVVEINDVEYVVRRECIDDLEIEWRPLQIVGVTEHLAYWKDLRRVLFSDAEFTILGRVARNGLQTSWTAIKLGDLFRAIAPDFDAQINSASLIPLGIDAGGFKVNVNESALREALVRYRDYFLNASVRLLSPEQDLVLASEIERLLPRAASATGQRSAFQVVHDMLTADTGSTIEAAEDSLMRNRAREASGLALFPALSNATVTITDGTHVADTGPAPRLLDVEVVAIYW